MGKKTITFTKLDGSPYTGAITFSTSYRYGRDSNGNNVITQCSAVDKGGGNVEVTVPSTDTVGVGYLVVPDTSNTDIKPRAQFVSDGPAFWMYGSTEANALPNVSIGPSAAMISATNNTTGANPSLTAVGGGSIVDAAGTVLFSVLRAALPDNTSWTYTVTSTGTNQVYPRGGTHNLVAALPPVALPDHLEFLPATKPQYASKIVRFTKADGNPYTGAITFTSSYKYARNSILTKNTDGSTNTEGQDVLAECVLTDLGGGYVEVTAPWNEYTGVGVLVMPSTGISDITPKALMVSFGPFSWIYGSTNDNGLPNVSITPSMLTITGNDLGGAENTFVVTPAGSIKNGASSSATNLFTVVRATLPTRSSWAWKVTPVGTNKLFPKSDSRDVRARIIYPPAAETKLSWSGDFRTKDFSQWGRKQFGNGSADTSILPDNIDDRLLLVKHETYSYQTPYGLLAHPKYGDVHSGGTRAELTAKKVNPDNAPGDTYFYEGDEVWVSWATKFSPDFELSSKWHVFSQAHQIGGTGSPPIAFTINDTNKVCFVVMPDYYDSINSSSEARFWTTTIRPGFWNHFLLHIKWSNNAAVGFVHLIVNGVEVVPLRMSRTMLDVACYWKLGFYRDQSVNVNQTVFHAGFNVYNSDPRETGTEIEPPATLPTGSKVVRFTKADGSPYVGKLAFSSEYRYARDSAGTNVTAQCSVVDLGGGYVQVNTPATDAVGVGYLLVPDTRITDVYPKAMMVNQGPFIWMFGTSETGGLPTKNLTPSTVTIVATNPTGASQTLPGVGAGSIVDGANTVALANVLRAALPDANSWNCVITPTGVNGITSVTPKADSRDVQTRIVYPAEHTGKLRWKGDFSSLDFSQWNAQFGDQLRVDANGDGIADTNIQILPDGVNDRLVLVKNEFYNAQATRGLKASPKQFDLHSGGTRAEVVAKSSGALGGSTGQGWFYEGDEVWISWATKFAPDYQTHSKWHVFSQAHQTLDLGNGGPMISFIVNGSTIAFSVMNGVYDKTADPSQAKFWTKTIRPGFWDHYLLHIKWSQNMAVGFVELWVNGVNVVPKRFHNNLDTDGIAYWKLGFYRSQDINVEQTVFHSNFNVYNSDPRVFTVTPGGGGGDPVDPPDEPPVDPEDPVDPPDPTVPTAPLYQIQYAFWPTGLPAPYAASKPVYAPADNSIRSSTETGPGKVRRRFTGRYEKLSFQLELKQDQLDIFQHFYWNIIQEVMPFRWIDLRTGLPCKYRFAGPPQMTYLAGYEGNGWWAVTVELETA